MNKKLYSLALACIMTLCAAFAAGAQVYQSVVPADGSTVSSLSQVEITFAADLVDFGAQYRNVTVTGTDNDYSAQCTLSFGQADNQIIVSMAEITANGTYTINFPQGALAIDSAQSAAFTLTYTVGEDISDVTMIPAPGDVKWIFGLVYCNNSIKKNLNVNYGVTASLKDASGETTPLTAVYDWQIGEGKYRLEAIKLVNTPGEYTVIIPDDMFYYYDENWEKVNVTGAEFKYNVLGGDLTDFVGVPSVEKPVSTFNHFELTFPGYETIEKDSDAQIYIYREGREQSVSSFYMNYNTTVEGNTLIYNNEYSSIIDAGHYFMTFPEGCVLLGEDKEPCTPFVYEFDIVEPAAMNIVFTPADGASVSMLNHVVVNFPDIDTVTLNSNASASLQQVNADGTVYAIGSAYGSRDFEQINDNTFDIHFSGMATKDGEYIIVIQKNSFAHADGFNQEVTLTVNFTAPETVAITIDPASGSTLDKIQNFTISFPGESVVKFNSYISNTTVTLYEGTELIDNGWGGYTNAQVTSASTFVPVEGTTNAFTFSLGTAVINKGEYLLTIPAGIFLIGEDEHTFNAAAQFTYSATGAGIDKIEVTPSHAVTALQDITITYVNETSISLQNEYVGFTLYKEVEGQAWGNYLEYASAFNNQVTIEGNQLKITLSQQYTEPGTYYIEITAYSLYMSDGSTQSTPQRVYFTVSDPSGIENVNVDAHDVYIYNINGIRVNDMSAPGLYIRDGKKVLVK